MTRADTSGARGLAFGETPCPGPVVFGVLFAAAALVAAVGLG